MAIVEIEIHDRIAVITLNRPSVRNAFDGPMARALGEAIDTVENDPGVQVSVLAAAITEPRPVFCAGHDLTKIEEEFNGGDGAVTERGGFAGFVSYPRTKPIIAAVDGLATSGGMEVVLACDMVVATRRSSFALAEVRWNLVAAAGGLFRLAWAVGRPAAMDMLLTGEPIDAERAYQLGLVGTLVDADATAAALGRAELIAANGPTAVRATLRVCSRAFSLPEDQLWAESLRAHEEIVESDDLKKGLEAFQTRRAPTFDGS